MKDSQFCCRVVKHHVRAGAGNESRVDSEGVPEAATDHIGMIEALETLRQIKATLDLYSESCAHYDEGRGGRWRRWNCTG